MYQARLSAAYNGHLMHQKNFEKTCITTLMDVPKKGSINSLLESDMLGSKHDAQMFDKL